MMYLIAMVVIVIGGCLLEYCWGYYRGYKAGFTDGWRDEQRMERRVK